MAWKVYLRIYDCGETSGKKRLSQHRPQIAWKGCHRFSAICFKPILKYIYSYKDISGQETNINTDQNYNYIDRHNHLYRKNVNLTRRWFLLPAPDKKMILTSGAGQKIILPSTHTSDNTLPDSHPLNLRTLTHTRIRRHLRRNPAGQPPPGSANPHPYTHIHTSDDTSDDSLPDSPPETNPQNLRTLTPILEVRFLIAKAIWGKHVSKLSYEILGVFVVLPL